MQDQARTRSSRPASGQSGNGVPRHVSARAARFYCMDNNGLYVGIARVRAPCYRSIMANRTEEMGRTKCHTAAPVRETTLHRNVAGARSAVLHLRHARSGALHAFDNSGPLAMSALAKKARKSADRIMEKLRMRLDGLEPEASSQTPSDSDPPFHPSQDAIINNNYIVSKYIAGSEATPDPSMVTIEIGKLLLSGSLARAKLTFHSARPALSSQCSIRCAIERRRVHAGHARAVT